MMRSNVSRQRSAFVIVAVLLLAFVVAGLADPDVAGKVAHEPGDVRETSIVFSRFGLSGYMLALSAALALVAIGVQRRVESPSLALKARLLAERAIFFFRRDRHVGRRLPGDQTPARACPTEISEPVRCLPLRRAELPVRHRQFSVGPHHNGLRGRSGLQPVQAVVDGRLLRIRGLDRPRGVYWPAPTIRATSFAGATLGSAVALALGRSFRDRGLLSDTREAAISPARDGASDAKTARNRP